MAVYYGVVSDSGAYTWLFSVASCNGVVAPGPITLTSASALQWIATAEARHDVSADVSAGVSAGNGTKQLAVRTQK